MRALILIFSVAWLFACSEASQGDGQIDPVYDRVDRTSTIRAGYVVYPPSFGVDPNTGEFYGISHDVLVEAADNMGLEVEFVEELAFGSIVEAVESQRVDIVGTGIWPTARRGYRAAFADPLFYSPVYAYVRDDDARFDGNIERANDPSISIAVIDGEMAAAIADSSFPAAAQEALPQLTSVSQLLLDVASGKADITFVEPAVANEYMEANPGQIRQVADVPPVRAFPTAYMLSHDAFVLREALNTTLGEMHRNGDVDRIIDRYEDEPGTFIRVTPYE